MLKNKKKLGIAVLLLIATVILTALYLIPYQLKAEYVAAGTLYEADTISKEDFKVYTVSCLGRKVEVKDFRINSDIVSSSGLVAVTSEKPKMGTLVDLNSISVVSSNISFNESCKEDFTARYEPKIVEKAYFADGTVKKAKIDDDQVEYSVDKKKDKVHLVVNGNYDQYVDSFDLTTIKYISTDSKISTNKQLNSSKLELVAHYTDGTSKTINNTLVDSEVIESPKKGNNYLMCSYNGEDYKVKVEGYDPPGKIKFDKYGTFTLKHSKRYYVPGASRLNSWVGVRYFNNHRETYYSQRTKGFAGKGLHIPGRHVAEDGTIRDKDGYICVASDLRYRKRYSTVLTTLGPAKVYDTGCAYGTIDLYVDW